MYIVSDIIRFKSKLPILIGLKRQESDIRRSLTKKINIVHYGGVSYTDGEDSVPPTFCFLTPFFNCHI